jgi:nitronate monooxygenase
MSPEEIRDEIRAVKKITKKPFGVDLMFPAWDTKKLGTVAEANESIPKNHPEKVALVEKMRSEFGLPYEKEISDTMKGRKQWQDDFVREQVEVVFDEGVQVLAMGVGSPDWVISEAKDRGMKIFSLIGNVNQAIRVKERGADIVVAQGYDAGGHTGRIGTFSLVPQVVDAVYPTPVLAAGGISDGRGLLASLALGAVGVWVGTAFQFAAETTLAEIQRKMLIEATEETPRITKLYTGKTMRSITNPLILAWEKAGVDTLPMPLQTLLISDLLAGAIAAKKQELLLLPAGQGVGILKEIKPARQILNEMVEGALNVLNQINI